MVQSSSSSAFARPVTQLSDELLKFFDALEYSQDITRLLHLRTGRHQLETFVKTQHEKALQLEQIFEKESSKWANLLGKAKADLNIQVKKRQVLVDLLPGLKTLYDIKVGKRGRPDDAVYSASPYARKWLPRGNCIAEYNLNDGKKCFFPLIRGYRKFTGQEDNGELKQPQEKDEEHVLTFFLKPQSHSKWVISTTKENGETGHLAVLKRSDGEFVYVVGSKNTHLVVQTLEDIERTRELGKQVNGGDVFFAATSISIPILRMIMTLEAPKRTLLCEFLWQTRATASFEVLCLSHQHVQLLDYLTQDTPVFYGLSLMSFNSPDDAEMCVNPVLLYEFMRALGVRTVAYDIAQFTPENVENVLERSKRAYKHEGSVHLFLDDRAAVIGMQKSKSIWYVCLRAIREKAKSFCRTLYSTKVSKDRTTPLSPIEKLDTAKKAIHARFKTIPPFLKISDEVANVYETLGKQFIEYLFEFELFCGLAASGDQKEQCKQVTKDVTNLFPMMWRKFLDHTGQTDDFSLQSS